MVFNIYNKFLKEYCNAKEYEKNKLIDISNIDFNFNNLPKKINKVGYIVATCSPVTKAHIELANLAIKNLKLNLLYFIIWPFYYIPGFHSENMLSWIKEQKHYDWDIRISLLEKALKDNNNPKIKILYEAKSWYIESNKYFDLKISNSYFWTGSWFVIRKLQTILNDFYLKKIKKKGGGI